MPLNKETETESLRTIAEYFYCQQIATASKKKHQKN